MEAIGKDAGATHPTWDGTGAFASPDEFCVYSLKVRYRTWGLKPKERGA